MTYHVVANALRPRWVQPKTSFIDKIWYLGCNKPLTPQVVEITGRLFVNSDTDDWDTLMRDLGMRMVEGAVITGWRELGSGPTWDGKLAKMFQATEFEWVGVPVKIGPYGIPLGIRV